MAIFEPGHVHIQHTPQNLEKYSYNLNIYYSVVQDPTEGRCMEFRLKGEVQGKEVDETFKMAKDQAFNFASDISRRLIVHGLPESAIALGSNHKFYDRMFKDIQEQLGRKPGDPINPEHLE
ncbi:DUF5064 family protein [Pseudomonas mosselii]|uniref:DUF5064 family protein n=1 Tax=Pseudomonas mosselii TaxID=78327 RepID=UPI0007865139|nr:DUF5064 family protein [Pseudomonas mosselii]ATB66419.1 DUF5064 domain-containing protein [Pseudomonas mosselii]MBC3450113.1 DUF5064 family protein [Pseudomonas mosselii]MDH1101547.1 DUF5064 family protein [Pseudomonas mosselii]MDN4496844.1 DUF5064 family protein [Pseudomonas mosselii]MEA3235105.1 DUF5064 family protein [Pseudomonas mosselii]